MTAQIILFRHFAHSANNNGNADEREEKESCMTPPFRDEKGIPLLKRRARASSVAFFFFERHDPTAETKSPRSLFCRKYTPYHALRSNSP